MGYRSIQRFPNTGNSMAENTEGLNILSHQGNEYQNYFEVSHHTCQSGQDQFNITNDKNVE